MGLLKRLLVYAMSGAVLGAIVSSLIAPSVLISQNTTRLTSECSCVDVTRDTAAALIQWQLVGAGIGAVALLILGIVLSAKSRAKPASTGGGVQGA